ncbi:hypothetical protein [Scytonema sp. NUACC26]|uniref:hypothetical protein n=1 Tax=Scytonema sp. NUACC26 TaxID=3140176 RepID=UPI0038B29C11
MNRLKVFDESVNRNRAEILIVWIQWLERLFIIQDWAEKTQFLSLQRPNFRSHYLKKLGGMR